MAAIVREMQLFCPSKLFDVLVLFLHAYLNQQFLYPIFPLRRGKQMNITIKIGKQEKSIKG